MHTGDCSPAATVVKSEAAFSPPTAQQRALDTVDALRSLSTSAGYGCAPDVSRFADGGGAAVAAAAAAAGASAAQTAQTVQSLVGDLPRVISMAFADAGAFSTRYQRNNKAKGRKNLRCFPACRAEGHVLKGYCGRPGDELCTLPGCLRQTLSRTLTLVFCRTTHSVDPRDHQLPPDLHERASRLR